MQIDESKIKNLLVTDKSKLWVVENYTKDYYKELKTLPLLVEPPIRVFGKDCNQRRNIGFFSDTSVGYKYSGQIMHSQPLSSSSLLQSLLPKVNDSLGTNFNGILVNRYVNGEKHLGAHSDDEKSLATTRNIVAAIAYGEIRTFRIRDKKSKKIVLDHPHLPRSLLIMEGDFQKEFTHEIPIQKRIKGDRISLTFRSHTK